MAMALSFSRSVFFTTLLACCRVSSSQICGSAAATAGGSFRWPTVNPALVAPVGIKFDYKPYTEPMRAEFTGRSLSIPVPKDFIGGVTLAATNRSGSNVTAEVYKLSRIELRKPGRAPEGVGQALSHTLELALVHQQVGGNDYVLNLVIPFEVTTGSGYDVLAPLLIGATLPIEQGQREPVLLSSAHSLDLNVVMQDATFLNFWTELPTDCSGTVNARQFMRTKVAVTGQNTYDALLDVFQYAPDFPPLSPPETVYHVGVCPAGTAGVCNSNVAPSNVTAMLEEARGTQSTAVAELRDRKTLMDAALLGINSSTTTAGALRTAVSARQDLKTAESELLSVIHYTDNLESMDTIARAAVWDADAPHNRPANGSGTPANFAGEVASAPAPAIPDAAPAAAPAVAPATGTQLSSAASLVAINRAVAMNCEAYGKSPINILSKEAKSPGSALLMAEPLRFDGMSVKPRAFRIHAEGDHLRIAAGPRETLGSIITGGAVRPLSYVDVRVPGEHAVDGVVADAEIQLVHVPAAGGAASVAVAVRLNAKNQDLGDNGWLDSLLQIQTLGAGNVLESQNTSPLAALHAGLRQGAVEHYFRYDGTTTSPPCRQTEWYVVADPGKISMKNLATLQSVFSKSLAAQPPKNLFSASLVARDTQLISGEPGVTAMGMGPLPGQKTFLQKIQM